MKQQWQRTILSVILAVSSATAAAQRAVPIRELGPVEATSVEPFRKILSVRATSAGALLVNDGERRQLVMLDDHLQLHHVLLDTASSDGHNYGPRASPMIQYLGDSTLFVDGAALSLLVIDPIGKIVRVMAAPNPKEFWILASGPSSVDKHGNLLYRGVFTRTSYAPIVPGTKPIPVTLPDSAPIVRANFETRVIDTLGRVRIQYPASTNAVQRDGRMYVTKTINPVVTPDEWAVLNDGTVAFVRGHDYHIDWQLPSGERRSSNKLPFDWKVLTEADKIALMDSARKAEEKLVADAKIAAKERSALRGEPASTRPLQDPDPVIEFVSQKEMGDYHPAIRYGAAIADADNNLWILPTTSAQSKAGELVYDVVNNRGELTHRVRVPAQRSIAGFGKGGVVYLMFRDESSIWHIERTRTITTKGAT